jgi:hypothetical protein
MFRIFPITGAGPLWGSADTTAGVAECVLSVENDPFVAIGLLYRWITGNRGINQMADVTIVFWRDIPAQVIVGKGRRGAKKPLSERFEQAIDRAAMKVGASDTDAYLAEWRKAAPYPVEGVPSEIVEAEAARLEAEYDQDRLKALIANDGWA